MHATGALCVTLKVCSATLIEPFRVVVPGSAVTEYFTAPVPVPLLLRGSVMIIQSALLLDTVHGQPAGVVVTVMVPWLASVVLKV